MITVIVNHYVLQERFQQADARVKESGRVMRSYPGFVSRQTLYAQQDPMQITTVTTWRSLEDYQRWDDRNRPQPSPGAPTRWSRPVEKVVFEVTPEL